MKRNQGQVLLVVVVAVAAVVTLVLSVVSRSVIDVKTTSSQEDSVRAFSAAESGVEKALLSGAIGSGTITAGSGEDNLNNATATYNVINYAEGQSEFVHPKQPLSGEDATIWLVSHDQNGDLSCAGGLPCYDKSQIRICWGNPGTASDQASTPAIEVATLYDPTLGSIDDVELARAAFDPNVGRLSSNSFELANVGGCTINGVQFAFSKVVDFTSMGISNATSAGALKFIKVRLLYNTSSSQQVGVQAMNGGVLPGQGKQVESTGISGDATRKVVVYSLFPDLPSVFDSVVYSSGGISK